MWGGGGTGGEERVKPHVVYLALDQRLCTVGSVQ